MGEWVDAMVRFEGTVVNPLAATLLGDWILETVEPVQKLIDDAGLGRAQPMGTAKSRSFPRGRASRGTACCRCSLG